MTDFDVSVQQLDEVCRVVVVGELDIATAPMFRESLAEARGAVVIDCTEMNLVDSTGLAELVMLLRRGLAVTLVKPSSIVGRVLEVTGLTKVVLITD
jgi:anti-anti-sigma factor